MNCKNTQTAPPLLAVESLKVTRGDVDILKGINWRIQPGENWAILGANGCGKTTLLSAITAYRAPSSGEIHVVGETYGESDWNEIRQQLGIVSSALSQRVPSDEWAIETVLSGQSAQLGYWTREKKVDSHKALRCLGKMGVRALAKRAWGVLSQGERQKVFIARALINDPQLLILDEPCAGLDPVARERFLVSLTKLTRLKKSPAIVLVTHHVEEIIPQITHVLLLKKGKVFAAGPKREVLLQHEKMSKAFGANIHVQEDSEAQRFWMKF
ncbi:ATP-binding cassette domain-containing protein [Coraliomargarita sp. SDUM461004]|uniref:ATP-binding cassette domain-containing protein n=1 Tax=Thalassobacterium sedimentorum TaxID=3041258 RepID=A0ABU1AG96_9BACT|nr:ATP-binding cassette domain-containing protein [Coraliomargarita sp. SDUM461004]MDQ8192850.1 ATP-binding cassette domain-containing protein [Coraliomargarita sp. SDUM461004]